MGRLDRILRLDATDVGRSVEAVAAILVARVALRVWRLESLAEFSRALSRAASGVDGTVVGALDSGGSEAWERVAWATGTAGAVLGATCLPRSVALQWMLARRGVESDLCLGFPRRGPVVPGHAWVEVGSTPLGQGRGAVDEAPDSPALELFCRLPLQRDVDPGRSVSESVRT